MAISIFISHASEDKASFVRPLAALLNKHYDVWFDEYSINLGDSILDSIQKGIASADFGLIVLSPNFLRKKWTKAELDGLYAMELNSNTILLPIWLDISFDEVSQNAPIFAGRLAALAANGVEYVASQVAEAIINRTDSSRSKPLYEVEIEELESINEIIDPIGKLIRHTNHIRIRAIRDGVKRYVEHFQSDGSIDNFSVTPGKVLNVRHEESIVYLESDLGRVLNNGDVIERTLACEYHDDVSGDEGYWVIRESNPTKSVILRFIFPKSRPPISVTGETRKLTYRQPHSVDPEISQRPDGRKEVIWRLGRLGLQTAYILRWKW